MSSHIILCTTANNTTAVVWTSSTEWRSLPSSLRLTLDGQDVPTAAPAAERVAVKISRQG